MRLKLKAKQTSDHSPAALTKPRKENWRKPMTSLRQAQGIALMMPITGSTVDLRNA